MMAATLDLTSDASQAWDAAAAGWDRHSGVAFPAQEKKSQRKYGQERHNEDDPCLDCTNPLLFGLAGLVLFAWFVQAETFQGAHSPVQSVVSAPR